MPYMSIVMDRSVDTPPVRIHAPDARVSPFVFASPHSGRCYPPTFLDAAAVGLPLLRRSEDAYVDQLFAEAPALGAPLVEAMFPRAVVDPNRAADELDTCMFVDGPDASVVQASPRAAAGLGVVPRVAADGRPIHAGPLSFAEAQARLRRYYRPYHACLRRLIDETRDLFGVAYLIDCHSMPSASARGADIVLGDRFGASCSRELVQLAEAHFRALGFAVVRNRPYAGGYITEHYGQPLSGVHALQVEINRGLYLNEQLVSPASGMPNLTRTLTEWMRRMMQAIDFQALAAE